MSKLYLHSMFNLKAVVAVLLWGLAPLVLADEPTGQLIDSPYEAVEARAIELVTSAGGDVVGVRGEGCPGCPASSLLPSGDLIVEAGGRRLQGSDLDTFNGRPGVIHIYRPTGMAHRVSFTGVVSSGGDEQ
ncbi:hypothetical protein [uncultured Marinobacter sp.]|uniref:hypothetical protein n=1 Tax=uncultured Marinobacter sp. TaxID=187379 RepID=UPI002630E2E4|nr:hypothetical protein [uncultured Marinobacter sp.]